MTDSARHTRRPPHRFRLLRAVLAVLAVLPGCRTAESVRDNVKFRDVGGYVEVTGRWRQSNQRSKLEKGDVADRELLAETDLKIETQGHVYHPNLLDFSLGALFGWLHEEFYRDFGGETSRSDDAGPILEFEFTGNILKRKRYPALVTARRIRHLEPRPFLPSVLNTTQNYGLNWQYISPKTPTNFRLDYTDIVLDPLRGEEQKGRQTNFSARLESGYRLTTNNVLSLMLERKSLKEDPFNLEYDSNEVTIGHHIDFGSDLQHRLDSELNYFDQNGTFDVERTRLREILRLSHAKSLSSWFQLELTGRTQGNLAGVEPIKETRAYLAGTVEHRLYESLISQLNGFVQRQDFQGGPRIDWWGTRVNLDYRKKNPWGVLKVDYSPGYQVEDRSGGEQRVAVVNERHVFIDPDPIVIANTNIDPRSVVISSEDGTIIYQEGRDYTIDAFPDRIEIFRVPTGTIPDESVVLVDYVFDLLGGFEITTASHNLRMRHSFDFGLSPYYRYRWQDQTVKPGEATGTNAEDIKAHTVGAEFRRWGVELMAEYESHDSNISPFEALRLGAGLSRRFDSGATGSIRGRWSDISRPEPIERDTTLWLLEGRYFHPFSANLSTEGVVMYRNQTDTLSRDDRGVELQLSIEWLVRQSELRLQAEYSRFEDDFADSDAAHIWLQFRRKF